MRFVPVNRLQIKKRRSAETEEYYSLYSGGEGAALMRRRAGGEMNYAIQKNYRMQINNLFNNGSSNHSGIS
jgi:hypothetical protein